MTASPTERRVEDLISDDPGMREAIKTVVSAADDGKVEWSDVKDDISSGQWGRLIERGVLEKGDTGASITDPEAIESALADEGEDTIEVPDSEMNFTSYDKLAAAGTATFFAGYLYAPVRQVVAPAMDLVLGPLQGMLPFYGVVMVIALFTGLNSTLLRANLMDMERMSAYQERMNQIQERRKAAKERGDEEELQRIKDEQMEAMGDQLGMFKEQARPMIWIMFVTIPAFLWMFWEVGLRGVAGHGEVSQVIIPLAGQVSWTTSILGPLQVWIVWYFLCSMAFTQVLQKALDIKMSPS